MSDLGISIALAVAVVSSLLFQRFFRDVDKQLDTLRERTGVELDAEMSGRMHRRLRKRDTYQTWGVVLSLPAMMAAVVYTPYAFLPATIIWCGAYVGVAIGDLRRIRKTRERTRVAHVRSTDVDDYVSPVQTLVTRGLVLLPLVPACAMPFLTSHGGGRWSGFVPLLTASLLLIGYMVACEAAQRWVVSQPQRALTSEELLLEDALRAATLQSIIMSPAMFGALTAALGFSAIASRVPLPGLATALRSTPLIGFVTVGGLLFMHAHFHYRFHERIWAHHDRV